MVTNVRTREIDTFGIHVTIGTSVAGLASKADRRPTAFKPTRPAGRETSHASRGPAEPSHAE
jgi:hypothetical protein